VQFIKKNRSGFSPTIYFVWLKPDLYAITELIQLVNINANDKKFTIDGLSHKMRKGTLRFEEFEFFAKLLGYEIVLRKIETENNN
jgi:hypothetical protein